MSLSVQQALARVPAWATADGIQISLLSGGITNTNARVTVAGESFVLRLGGENTDLLGINRPHEYAAIVAAGSLGIAPELIYWLDAEGLIITRFIEGKPLPKAEMGQPDTLRRVVAALQQIHDMAALPGHFSPFRTVEDYAATASRYGIPFPSHFAVLMERMKETEASLLQRGFIPRPCHNDLLNENFLDDGQIRILDWEYAAMGDVVFDLANFAVNHDFTDVQDGLLLEFYFGAVSPAAMARLKLLKIVSESREAMWGLVQAAVSKLEFDFRSYAALHFERMTLYLKDPRYHHWLEAAADV